MTTRRVVITGLGMLTPLGTDVASTWDGIKAGKSGIRPIEHFDTEPFSTRFAGLVPEFDITDYLPAKDARKMDPFIHYGLAAAIQAIENAELEVNDANADRIGISIGSGIGGLPGIEEGHQSYLTGGARRITPFFVPRSIINMISGNLSIRYGIRGPNIALVSACATGTHSIGTAARMIAQGEVDVMVAGGAVFIFAMGWDISDTRRVTRRSDVAFWLHLLAAPLLMHPLFKIIGVMDGDVSTSVAGVILGVFVGITLISLLIDRRALMVSSLAYVLYAMNALFDSFGTLGQQLGLTGLIVGCSMVLLTAYWDRARTSLLKPLPDSVSNYLPMK